MRGADIGVDDHELPPVEAYAEEQAGSRQRVNGHDRSAPQTEVLRPGALKWDELDGRDPPAREWIMPYWIPHKHVTLLTGRGGIGKTLLAQHIGTAVALGLEYIEPLQTRRVLMWAGEDDADELWRRQQAISSYMQRPLSALTERFYLHSYTGIDITLATTVFGQLMPTPMLNELRDQVADYKAQLVIIDNSARVFGASENDRHAVTTYLAWLQGACANAAVLLLAHPGKAVGSEFSGSTAWEGAVRSRLYLSDKPPDANLNDEDAAPDERVRYLARRKANYSALDLRRLALIEGSLIPDLLSPGRLARPTGEFAKDIVRCAVRTLAARDIHGSGSTSSPTYLPKLAMQYKLLDSMTQKAFAATMREMVLAGQLVGREVGKYSNRTPRIGLVLP